MNRRVRRGVPDKVAILPADYTPRDLADSIETVAHMLRTRIADDGRILGAAGARTDLNDLRALLDELDRRLR